MVGALTLSILSVYAGSAVSKLVQELCFAASLIAAPAGACLHLVLGSSGNEAEEGVAAKVAHALSDAAAAAAHASGSSSVPSLYLCGVLISASFALFNLCHNKRQQAAGSSSSSSPPTTASNGGGFIPGRDDVEPRHAQARGSGAETPQVQSPGSQYKQRAGARNRF